MKKLFLLCVIMFLLVFFVKSQENQKSDDKNDLEIENIKHGIGGAAGFTTGYGLSYRYYLDKVVFQGTFAPLMENKDDMTFSTGLTFMYRLVSAKNTRFYLYESNHWHYNYYENESNFINYNGIHIRDYSKTVNNNIHLGLGIGFEFILWDRVSLNIMTGYSYKYGRVLNKRLTYENELLTNDDSKVKHINMLHPTIETGLYYCF